MTDFLDSLLARAVGDEQAIAPRVPSRFERLPSGIPSRLHDQAWYRLEEEAAPAEVTPAETAARAWDIPHSGAASDSLESRITPEIVLSQPFVEPRAIATQPTRLDAALNQSHAPALTTSGDRKGGGTSADDSVQILRQRIDRLVAQLAQLRSEAERVAPDAAPDLGSPPTGPVNAREHGPVPPRAAEMKTIVREGGWPPALEEPSAAKPGLSPHAPTQTSTDQAPPTALPRSPLSLVLPPASKTAPPRIIPEELPAVRGTSSLPPTVNVTIGCVEVKAIRQPVADQTKVEKASRSSAVMTLDEYLQRRSGGAR